MNKKRALLLDRDGVINQDDGYIGSVARFVFMPGLFPFLRTMRDRGFALAVLTNQSGVARGLFSETDYAAVTAHMVAGLAREGIAVDLTLASFEHPEAVSPVYARESFWRKPNPGMVLEATRRLGVDPARSVFIGDSERDMQAAQAGGISCCLWLTDKAVTRDGVKMVGDFAQALRFIP